MITVTESAVKQLQAMLPDSPANEGRGLRVFVEAGGCAGMQYGMRFDARREDDRVVECGGARLLVDPASAEYLEGVSIDFVDGLTGAGFRIHNPNAARTCGCGTSFERGAGA